MIYEEKMKPIKLSFAPGAPVKFSDSDEDFNISLTHLQRQTLLQVGEAIAVYLKTAKELLNGKYSAIREVAPLHLSNPGNVLVLYCQDGLIIRIVIGRSNSLTEENKRKLVALENESPKTKIMTYDDVLVNAKAVVENLLGPIWETYGATEVFYLPDK